MRRLWRFDGGVHLDGCKTLSTVQPVRKIGRPKRVYLPLQQHIGTAAEPLVAVGDQVDKGQPVATPASFVSAAVHASVSGRVIDLGDYTLPHPSGIAAPRRFEWN